MKARIANSLSARCAGACPPKRAHTREGQLQITQIETNAISQKRSEITYKTRGKSKESPPLFTQPILNSKKQAFSVTNTRISEINVLPLRLIKHNLPFPVALRHLYSVKQRTYSPFISAQTIFDLQNVPHRKGSSP